MLILTKNYAVKTQLTQYEPRAQRTFTPSQAVLARSAGVYHWTADGRQLYDYTSGVLVANLGHNPVRWTQRFFQYLGWTPDKLNNITQTQKLSGEEYFEALTLTAYNAVTPIEIEASRRLIELMHAQPGGQRMQQVLWAASGSEAIQKALWASLARDRTRDMIVATRYGFHGKKGIAGAVTGSETDHDRDPRVRFISFPMKECDDVSQRQRSFDATSYLKELEALKYQFGRRLSVLITEPYLGGGGSYHPPKAYLQALQQFCRDNDMVFILDEVQANFGRTGRLFAYEAYGLEPDIVVLGKGLGNGVPVAAAVGRRDLFAALNYGEGSDTWSANTLCCAGVLATLDEFASRPILEHSQKMSAILEAGLVRLQELPFVAHIRGEQGGMVWGVEFCDHAGQSAADWANRAVLQCYLGQDNQGIHLLGPLSGKVVRIAPPLTITATEARQSVELLYALLANLMSAAGKTSEPPALART